MLLANFLGRSWGDVQVMFQGGTFPWKIHGVLVQKRGTKCQKSISQKENPKEISKAHLGVVFRDSCFIASTGIPKGAVSLVTSMESSMNCPIFLRKCSCVSSSPTVNIELEANHAHCMKATSASCGVDDSPMMSNN